MSLEDIKNAYKTRTKCKETGCDIKTGGMRCVIIDAEQYHRLEARMCDCIVVADRGHFIIGACELKSGKYEVHKVKEQLEEGVRLAEQIRDRYLFEHECKILPILVGKKPKGMNGILLERSSVTINGKKRPIIWCNCGTSMSKIVNDVSG